MQGEKVRELVEKYLKGAASKEEEEQLLRWYWRESSIESEWELANSQTENDLKSKIYANMIRYDDVEEIQKDNRKFSRLGLPILLIVLLGLAAIFYTNRAPKENISQNLVKVKSNDILPGGSKAILTLSDGRTIELEESQNGILVNQGGIKVQKNSDGVIEYTFSKQQEIGSEIIDYTEPLYNTIETPVGGKYQLNLADGSKVWLNSSSSLRFPIFFSEENREVELQGEAYFEVSKDYKR
ncbi:MAG: FecR domain-containing protein, partial [Bacteroidetes bacterium]|nr:FecR domain-containing protein [Bacteroidota bacterium]